MNPFLNGVYLAIPSTDPQQPSSMLWLRRWFISILARLGHSVLVSMQRKESVAVAANHAALDFI
jgi:hypothetical protein